ncbi:MAG: hypothetical protein ACOCXZ_03630 [Chloroflexota bacterium]
MGDQTLCQLHRDGRVSGGLKYDEGRLVAVRAAIRLLRGTSDIAVFRAGAHAERARWQNDLDKYLSAERRSMPWVAYSQGGADTWQQVIALIDETPSG